MERKCKKCGTEIKWYNGSWNKNLCNKCFSKPVNDIFKGLFGVVILAVVIIVIFSSGGDSDKTPNNSDKQISVLSINAEQLMQDYTSNPISADEKYQDKIVSVGGMIYEVGQDWSGGNYVMLRKEYEYNGVQCEFETESDLINLHKGQYIVLQGKVIGFTEGIILIDDCSIKK